MTLGTSTDLFVETFERKAGVESGVLKNAWCESTYRIFANPAPVRTLKTGVAWEVFFKALDEKDVVATFHGFAETRRHAKQHVTDVITKHVYTVSELRKKFPFASTEEALRRMTSATSALQSEALSEGLVYVPPKIVVPHSVPDVVIKDASWRWRLRALVDRLLRWFRRR